MAGLCMSRSIRRVVIVMAAVAVLGAAHVASGQMELAVINGTVTDEAGAPLEGVSLRLKDVERGAEIIFKSDKDGRFYRRGLKAIEYEFVVEKAGYQPISNKLKLAAGIEKTHGQSPFALIAADRYALAARIATEAQKQVVPLL